VPSLAGPWIRLWWYEQSQDKLRIWVLSNFFFNVFSSFLNLMVVKL
jgi:hypothetical protein